MSDSEALLKLKQSFTNTNALDSWEPGSGPCTGDKEWGGLVCFNGIVTGLHLVGMGLSGKIDVEALMRSRFSGEIPPDYFVRMASLKKLWLSDNKFTGAIPLSIQLLSHLIELHLENNQFTELSRILICQRNAGLCGEELGNGCNDHGIDLGTDRSRKAIAEKKREEFDVLENVDESVEVRISGLAERGIKHQQKGHRLEPEGSNRSSQFGVGLQGGDGHRHCGVVKRMKEMNRVSKEGFDLELRRLGSLQHPNVLNLWVTIFEKRRSSSSTSTFQRQFAICTPCLVRLQGPEAVRDNQISPKCDVYCLGIVILEILIGKFPTQYLNNSKGGTDVVEWAVSAIADGREAEVFDPEIASSINSMEEMVKLLHIGVACAESNLEQRPDIKEAIRRIEEIHVDGGGSGGGASHDRTIQVLPSLRDGYGEVPVAVPQSSLGRRMARSL
ncbi:Pollen receptor-like kinase 3 [Vitis vinifera]|uniref:Pollen receptor-like kinase 3 n=1 Tax=Vitis vinifera TaxID=29760 RepID=A0A438EWN2_VITVI|nr:Pollen receptor-like kinase 3 [Vitis vinifera]